MSEISLGAFQAYRLTAIISLLFAVVGFSYNAWRLEQSEVNNIVRDASFQILIELAEFEQVIYARHYDQDVVEGSPRKGWVKIGLINDLSALVGPQVTESASLLKTNWAEHWNQVPDENNVVESLIVSVDAVRESVKARLVSLD